MSPRSSVQVLTSAEENLYASTRLLAGPAPELAWAMHLADRDGYFRWVCFDLDAGHGNTRADARRLTHWLGSLGIFYLECVSGPSGGRHVWVRVDRLHPEAVHTVAVLAGQLLPSLDTKPLSGRGNGAVRPPLAPHRHGGFSRPLGDVDELLEAEPVDEVRWALLDQLLSAEGAVLPTPALPGARGIVLDARGRRYIAGDRRDPSERIQTLLDGTSSELAEFTDMSRLQMIVLTGLARARWRFDDVAAHLGSSPAFEHSRTLPGVGGRRTPRRKRAPELVLLNDWARAVDFVAANPLSHGDDSAYLERVSPLVHAVEAVQARADALVGYWGSSDITRGSRAHRGRPSWRSVLDAVCVYILQSARPDPQINIRRLARDTGYSHEACRQALDALVDDTNGMPWLVRTEAATGVVAARYALHPNAAGIHEKFSTGDSEEKLAQGGMPPAPPRPPQHPEPLLRILGTRLQTLARDLFSSPGSLGRAAGRLLQQLSPSSWSTATELTTATRISGGRVRGLLHRLHEAGVVTRNRDGWRSAGADVLEFVDRRCPWVGYLMRRLVTYRAEGVRWRWWQAELHWLRLPRKQKRRRPVAMAPLIATTYDAAHPYPAYPRLIDGDPDHRGALQLVLAGAVDDHRAAA